MNDKQLNKVLTAITNLETKVVEGFARIEETKADKFEVTRIDAKVNRLIESHFTMDTRISNLEIALVHKADKANMERIFKPLDYIIETIDTDATEHAVQSN